MVEIFEYRQNTVEAIKVDKDNLSEIISWLESDQINWVHDEKLKYIDNLIKTGGIYIRYLDKYDKKIENLILARFGTYLVRRNGVVEVENYHEFHAKYKAVQ